MKINALKIEISTTNGEYGFSCSFLMGLNIIRGNNSSGKSTLLNSMIYALGMEELIGNKGDKTLPYALKEYVPNDEDKYKIVNSRIILEIQNQKEEYLSLIRSIRSDEKNNKLIELIDGPYLTGNVSDVSTRPTYIHDAGSAQDNNVGFFRVLEEFLGLKLPNVPSTSGSEVKLYLQTIFSALIIEQKRGWTDYIANTPYFSIRNVHNKIIEYLLSLDVFENDRVRNKLNLEIIEIHQLWDTEKYKIKLIEDNNRLNISGVPIKPSSEFDQNLVTINKLLGEETLSLNEHISNLVDRIQQLKTKSENNYKDVPDTVIKKMELAIEELSRLNSLHESIVSEIHLNKSLLTDYSSTKESASDDLKKNKLAKKLKALGADFNLEISKDSCPTCHQHVDDSLLLADMHVQPMNIDENIVYLDKQTKMLDRYMHGVENLIQKQNRQLTQIQAELSSKKSEILGIKHDISSVSEISEADLRNQLRYEDEILKLESAEDEFSEILSELNLISIRFKENKVKRASLPTEYLSRLDKKKIRYMESAFKTMARKFGYKSADANEIILNQDTYLPFLSGLALREINETKKPNDADIKADSSASDFVRLIWSYLLSIYDTSKHHHGNHPGLIALDEPGQHSMRDTSVNALFKAINSYAGLQGIIAASFDENDDVFQKETEGVNFHLIEVGDKLIKKI